MTHPLFSKLDQRVVDCGKRNRPGNAVTVMEIILQMMAIGNSTINLLQSRKDDDDDNDDYDDKKNQPV